MSKLYEKLNNESAHIKLTHAEKAAMRAAIFGAPAATPSPVRVAPSHYVFLSSTWMRALAAVLVVVFVSSGTAFASEGSLPGQPLYAIKTKVLEPMQVALASTPAQKAAVHVAIAATRVAEAEALAQQGNLYATTSAELAAHYEANAARAVALADEASTTDPSASAEVRAQIAANSTVGSAVLVALADHGKDRDHADAFAARVLAVATGRHGDNGDNGDNPMRPAAARPTVTMATAPATNGTTVRTFAAFSAQNNDNTEASGTEAQGSTNTNDSVRAMAPTQAKVAVANPMGQKIAANLQLKAQAALSSLRTQFAAASSTLNATTTVSIDTQLSGIDSLMQDGATALNDSLYDTAVQDFTQALARSLRLSALLTAQQKFDNHIIDPLIKDDGGQDNGGGHGGSQDGNSVAPLVHDILQGL